MLINQKFNLVERNKEIEKFKNGNINFIHPGTILKTLDVRSLFYIVQAVNKKTETITFQSLLSLKISKLSFDKCCLLSIVEPKDCFRKLDFGETMKFGDIVYYKK